MTLAEVHLMFPFLNLVTVFLKLATAGDNQLGGDDFDQVIIDYL